MSRPLPRRLNATASPLTPLVALVLFAFSPGMTYGQEAARPESAVRSEHAGGQEFSLRGQRAARDIKYSDWRKVCFKVPGANKVCRTSIVGTFGSGQTAVRIDLTEREGDAVKRLQLFLPVGLYLQAGVKLTVDQGPAYRIPYVWCLTNTCIAADVADPELLKGMETGQKLQLEVVDSNVLTVSTTLPINQFAAVRQGTPAQIFEQKTDE